jgi:hypothetical protein
MTYSPDIPGAIQARLVYLRLRKTALDELILALERYSVYEIPVRRKAKSDTSRTGRPSRIAGAA